MKISVVVGYADGETFYAIETPSKAVALMFLQQHDHEGSSVSIEVEDYPAAVARRLEIPDIEQAYAWLRRE